MIRPMRASLTWSCACESEKAKEKKWRARLYLERAEYNVDLYGFEDPRLLAPLSYQAQFEGKFV